MSAVHFSKGLLFWGQLPLLPKLMATARKATGMSGTKNGKIKDNSDPNIATDHRGHLEEDTRLMAEMGIRHYRFGLEWARLEPQEGQFSQEEIEKGARGNYAAAPKWHSCAAYPASFLQSSVV